MGLKIWLPLNGTLQNQGTENITVTNINATIDNSGKIGQCYYFNGTNARIACSQITCSYPITIMAWFKPTDFTNTTTQYWLSYNTNSGGASAHAIGIGTYQGKLSIWGGGANTNTVISANTINNDNWYHIAVSISESKRVTLYLNGEQVNTWTVGNHPGSTWFTLGARSNSATGGVGNALYYYKGYMNDVRFYNRVVSPREIKEIAKGMVLHYPLSPITENSVFGDIVTDQSPYKIRAIPNNLSNMKSKFDQIVGGSIVWNQLIGESSYNSGTDAGVTHTPGTDGKMTLNGTVTGPFRITKNIMTTNHKYYVADANHNVKLGDGYGHNANKTNGAVISPTGVSLYVMETSGTVFDNVEIRVVCHDLTAMFGSTIADYIYSLEQSTSGAGVTWFKNLFPNTFYSYNIGELQHVTGLSEYKTVGFNLFDGLLENGDINESTGQNSGTSTSRTRCVNYIYVIPGTSYYFKTPGRTGNFRVFYYDADKTYISYNSIPSNSIKEMPSNTYYMRFRFASGIIEDDSNICINQSQNDRNGEYEAYTSTSYPLDSSLILRGIPKLDTNNNLYYDGDTYDADGTITRRYGIVDLGSLTWTFSTRVSLFYASFPLSIKFPVLNATGENNKANIITTKYITVGGHDGYDATYNKAISGSFWNGENKLQINDSSYSDATIFKAAMSGVYLVYELATSTTEVSTSFINPQSIDSWGTEEYVTTGIVPVGHNSKYISNEIEGASRITYDGLYGGLTDNIEYDVSGYKHNGTKNGTITASSDTARYTTSSVFDGSASNITATSLPLETRSISFWMYNMQTKNFIIFADKDTKLCFGRENDHINTYTTNTRGTTFNSSLIINNTWLHIVLIKIDDTTRKLYVNGIEQSPVSTNYYTHNKGGLAIGCRETDSKSLFYNGLISDFRVYVTELSEDDILELYRVGASLSNNGALMAYEFSE